MDKHLFISGMEKCGTTALAAWLVKQGFAEYLIPGTKEPYIYARPEYTPIPKGSGHDVWRLDASVAYALNPVALTRMPLHRVKIILCFRNIWERTWSAYKMKKYEQGKHGWGWRQTALSHFPVKSRDIVAQYFNDEALRLREGSFLERVKYEMNFFFSYGGWPFFPILHGGRYRMALKNLLQKYAPEQILCVDVRCLNNVELRRKFIENFLEMKAIEIPPIEQDLVGLQDYEIPEDVPDFSLPEFDDLRSFFAYDLQGFEALFSRYGLTTEFMDFESLRRNVR